MKKVLSYVGTILIIVGIILALGAMGGLEEFGNVGQFLINLIISIAMMFSGYLIYRRYN